MIGRIALAGLGAAFAVAGLAGCGRAAPPPAGTPSGAPSTAASTQSGADQGNGTPQAGQPSAGTSAKAGTTTAECRTGQLSVTISGGDAGAGHRSKVLVFHNTSADTCVLQGYPGVAALDSAGRQVEQAQRTPQGYLGGLATGNPPLVRLTAGAAASATVEAVGFGPDGNGCTAYAGLLVTPPDETHPVRLGWDSDGCSGLQIHPVVPGTTGRSD